MQVAEAAPLRRTRVVNVKREECDVYIGRAVPSRGFAASPFANKFVIGRDGNRAEVLAKYRAWLPTQPHLMLLLESLRGQRLGCWCHPLDCHGDILVELIEGPAPPPAPEPQQEALF